MPDCSSIDPLVTPYVDGELPAADCQAVAEHVRVCPPCRSRILAERAVRDLVRARQPALCADRAPDALRAKCVAHGSRASRGSRTFRTAVGPIALAASLVLVVSGAFLYQLTGRSTDVMVAQLTADHVKCFLLHRIAGAEEPAASVERSLASAFGWPAHLPEDPGRAGLELVGERTCLYGQGRVAHIMYRHEGRSVSVFMLPNAARQDELVETLGHGAAVWSVGDRTFVLIAREGRADLERMASFVRAGLR